MIDPTFTASAHYYATARKLVVNPDTLNGHAATIDALHAEALAEHTARADKDRALLAPIEFETKDFGFVGLLLTRDQASCLATLLARHVDLDVVALDNNEPAAAQMVKNIITAAKVCGL